MQLDRERLKNSERVGMIEVVSLLERMGWNESPLACKGICPGKEKGHFFM